MLGPPAFEQAWSYNPSCGQDQRVGKCHSQYQSQIHTYAVRCTRQKCEFRHVLSFVGFFVSFTPVATHRNRMNRFPRYDHIELIKLAWSSDGSPCFRRQGSIRELWEGNRDILLDGDYLCLASKTKIFVWNWRSDLRYLVNRRGELYVSCAVN